MQYKQDGDTYIIYVEQDEEIMVTLTQFCQDRNIVNGQLSGIGAIKDIELGAYDLANKKYIIETIIKIPIETHNISSVILNVFKRSFFKNIIGDPIIIDKIKKE